MIRAVVDTRCFERSNIKHWAIVNKQAKTA
jgi:hypothetical protein